MSYQESQRLIHQAEEAVREGDAKTARPLFLEAAIMQQRLVEALPPQRVKTRSAYGLSVASLYFKANELDESERYAHAILSGPEVEPVSAGQLRDLLARIWNTRHIKSLGAVPLGNPLTLIFRGGAVGSGIAPLETIDYGIQTTLNLVRRFEAFTRGLPFDPRARSGTGSMLRALASEPVTGSYRISIYITAPEQLQIDYEAMSVSPDSVIDSAMEFMDAAIINDSSGVESLVPDQDYRTTLIRLARNTIPDGHSVASVEWRRASHDREKDLMLSASCRKPLNALLKRNSPPRSENPDEPRLKPLVGVLRAVDLDERDLRLVTDDGGKTPLKADVKITDDVLEPLLNRRVRVMCRQEKRSPRLVIEEIDLASLPAPKAPPLRGSG